MQYESYTMSCIHPRFVIMTTCTVLHVLTQADNLKLIQVAALAPLALLLVLEARCAHFVIAHFFVPSSRK